MIRLNRVKIVQIDSEDAGLLVLEQRESEVYFESVSIAPDLQKGFGSKIVSDVLAQAKVRGVPVTLDVLKTNLGAKKFYERFGFHVQGETDTHYFRMTNTRVLG